MFNACIVMSNMIKKQGIFFVYCDLEARDMADYVKTIAIVKTADIVFTRSISRKLKQFELKMLCLRSLTEVFK